MSTCLNRKRVERALRLCYDKPMEINILIDEEFAEKIDEVFLKEVAELVLKAETKDADSELGLVITNEETVHQLNRDYRKLDEPTDVLSFYMLPESLSGEEETNPFIQPPDGVMHLGEVIISYPQAVTQADEHSHSVKREIAILVIHGVLHLLGYDHEKPDDELKMRARETDILKAVRE
jgi:probable rRNA maturation factor